MKTVRLEISSSAGSEVFPVPEGMLLAEALRRCGHAPDMPCGGHGKCGKCRIRVSGALSEPDAVELSFLSGSERAQGIRLACRAQILGDVKILPGRNRGVSRICADGLKGVLGTDPLFRVVGAAVDIGTTTLAAHLYGEQGRLASATALNPQGAWGADVISRVGKAMEGEGGTLARAIRSAVADLLRELCRQAGRRAEEIDALVMTGNTAMLHLLTETDPSPLAAAPFLAKELFGKDLAASALEMPCAENAVVYLPRCVSAFVGGDITTALLAAGICDRPETAMLADIGTNGEIALWVGGNLFCCSTAAGPAFEGATLSQGMQGATGAIDHAEIKDGKLAVHTIGDAPAVGICGSGVADVLACLLKLEILDSTGLLDNGESKAWPLTEQVSFTQGDVRQVQLAKSAVRSGIESLLNKKQLKKTDLRELAIAGGFGSSLSLDSAAAIGLIPPELKGVCRILGNAALGGAAMILWDRALKAKNVALAASAETVDLATDPFFINQYIENMMF